jgi:signal transduction histidine kinase
MTGHPGDVPGYIVWGRRPRRGWGDNGRVGDVTPGTARGWLGQARDFVRAEPRQPMSRRAVIADAVFAGLVMVAAITVAGVRDPGAATAYGLCVAAVTTLPLAARRRYPLAAFLLLVTVALLARRQATDVTFVAIVIAAFSAALHSRFRGAALLSVAPVGVLVTVGFWNTPPPAPPSRHLTPVYRLVGPESSPHWQVYSSPPDDSWRVPALLVLVSLVTIAVVGAVAYAGDRIRRLQAEHSAATQRAVELERARIAGELHDVVTHNVSVMIVQAGAARQVLAEAPGEARAALLAVEASGRAAMAELRHMLGLLSAPGVRQSGGDGGGPDVAGVGPGDPQLAPQPGLSELPSLIGRLTAAGLPVELDAGELPRDLPPGQDLAAFRVVQEALTNVIKHAGKPPTRVCVHYREGSLMLEVADAGRLIPAAGPVTVPGSGRGLIGLRERVGLYGGEFEAGPRPASGDGDGEMGRRAGSGGWLVRARIPVAPAASRDQPLTAARP